MGQIATSEGLQDIFVNNPSHRIRTSYTGGDPNALPTEQRIEFNESDAGYPWLVGVALAWHDVEAAGYRIVDCYVEEWETEARYWFPSAHAVRECALLKAAESVANCLSRTNEQLAIIGRFRTESWYQQARQSTFEELAAVINRAGDALPAINRAFRGESWQPANPQSVD